MAVPVAAAGPAGPGDGRTSGLPELRDFDLAALAAEAVDIEVEVGITPERLADPRRTVFRQRAARPGLRARGAFAGEALVGFCVGCPSLPGSWWRDIIAPHAGASWLEDAYEVAELHVRRAWQRRGLGERLLREVLATAVPARRALLTTGVGATPARRLYARLGFVEIAPEVRFPGYAAPYALLGADLPLDG